MRRLAAFLVIFVGLLARAPRDGRAQTHATPRLTVPPDWNTDCEYSKFRAGPKCRRWNAAWAKREVSSPRVGLLKKIEGMRNVGRSLQPARSGSGVDKRVLEYCNLYPTQCANGQIGRLNVGYMHGKCVNTEAQCADVPSNKFGINYHMTSSCGDFECFVCGHVAGKSAQAWIEKIAARAQTVMRMEMLKTRVRVKQVWNKMEDEVCDEERFLEGLPIVQTDSQNLCEAILLDPHDPLIKLCRNLVHTIAEEFKTKRDKRRYCEYAIDKIIRGLPAHGFAKDFCTYVTDSKCSGVRHAKSLGEPKAALPLLAIANAARDEFTGVRCGLIRNEMCVLSPSTSSAKFCASEQSRPATERACAGRKQCGLVPNGRCAPKAKHPHSFCRSGHSVKLAQCPSGALCKSCPAGQTCNHRIERPTFGSKEFADINMFDHSRVIVVKDTGLNGSASGTGGDTHDSSPTDGLTIGLAMVGCMIGTFTIGIIIRHVFARCVVGRPQDGAEEESKVPIPLRPETLSGTTAIGPLREYVENPFLSAQAVPLEHSPSPNIPNTHQHPPPPPSTSSPV